MSDQEISPSGNPIYRYDNAEPKEFELAVGGDNIELISDHIESHIGKIESVFHEILSDKVHIDVHWVKPSKKFPFHTLVTSGMSDKPMNAPQEGQDFKYAELCILLPKEWKMSSDIDLDLGDEKNYWPLRWLKVLARFPHEYDTWLSWGHTIPNGEKVEPFAENTKLGCMLLIQSIDLPQEFAELKVSDDKNVHFFSLYPIYKEEMNFKLKKGTEALLDKFEANQIGSIVDINRTNTCKKKGPLGLW